MHTIMKKYDIAQHFIQQANPHLADINILLSGMKIKIPSSSKVVQASTAKSKKEKKKQRQTVQMEQDDPIVVTRKILYAHAHRRPMGQAIAYDQEIIKATQHGNAHEQVPLISGICCHCHQPIYSITPPS